MKKIIIIVILIIVVIGGFIGYRMYNEKTPDIVNRTPDVTVDAKNLLAAFEKDTASARRNYIDKIVEVTGMVKRVDTTGSVVLGDNGTESEVVIGLDRRHLKDHQQLKPGSVAVLQGVCSGYSKADEGDLLASLGMTVELRSAGVKNKH